ncbi:MAG: zinc-ribbon domain-containing protein [Lachnospiraceae bacterium]|nr:zinc-ribbon domain-containing protein [Lachnospiraceae bacterium]
MAFCSNCGAQLPEGGAFCANCGTPVQMQAAPGAVTQAAEEVQQAAGQAAEQFGQAQEQVAQSAEQFGQAQEQVAQSAEQFGQAAQESAEQFGQQAQESAEQFGQQAEAFGAGAASPQPAMQMTQDPMQQQAWQQGQAYAQAAGGAYAQSAGAYAQPEKKSKKGLIIGLSIGGAVLVAGIILLILFLTGVIGGAKGPQAFIGSWKFDSMEAFGMKITAETFTAMGMGDAAEVAEMRVDISADGKVTMNVMGLEESIQGQFNGDKLTVSEAGQTIDFVIEDGKLVFSMEESGIEAKMTFVRR